MTSEVESRPLTGLRALDLTIVVAGPVGGGVLADLGAEVIKVEHVIARRGQIFDVLPLRAGVEDRPWNRSNWFHDLNRSKLGVTLDLSVPSGREALLRLVALSDVLMENFSPRVMPNLKLDYEVLREANPELIMVSMPGFGSTGPMRDRTAFGPGIEAMTGLSDLTGYQDGPPLKPGNYITDYNAAMLAAFSVMAALHYRRRTGRGQRVEVALREGALQMIGEHVMAHSMNGASPSRMGNRHPAMAPHGVYPCRGEDRWIAIAIDSDSSWRAFCGAMGSPVWAEDPRFATAAGRLHHQDEIDAHIAEWTRERDHYSVMRALQHRGIDAAAALTTEEIASDPHFQARGFVQEVDIPDAGPARYPRYGFQLSRTPVQTGAGPNFGAHNRLVFGKLLGMPHAAIEAMAAEGAIADRPSEKTRA